MKIIIFQLILLATLFVLIKNNNAAHIVEKPKTFINHKLYSVTVETNEQLNVLRDIENNSLDGFLFWNNIAQNKMVDILVAPEQQEHFQNIVNSFKFSIKLKNENIQNLIDNERPKAHPRTFGWTDYNTFDEINAWLDQQIEQYPNILTNYNIGQSFQNRTIRVIKLSYNEGNPAVFLESNIHAREWITSATATWFLNELLTSNDEEIRNIAENIDWYILPVFNVDGFVYSHDVNRLWRKTRKPHAHLCYGTDPNRNYDFHWLENGGASSNPCSESFAGPNPFSEPEVVAVSEFIKTISANLKIYFTFHSYGQYILFPYGHDYVRSPNHDDFVSISDKMIEGFGARFGTDYVAGTASEALYIASGTSIDWAYGVQNVSLTFTIELRDRRGGPYGFILPADQIIDNCLETKDALVEMIYESRRLGYF